MLYEAEVTIIGRVGENRQVDQNECLQVSVQVCTRRIIRAQFVSKIHSASFISREILYWRKVNSTNSAIKLHFTLRRYTLTLESRD